MMYPLQLAEGHLRNWVYIQTHGSRPRQYGGWEMRATPAFIPNYDPNDVPLQI